ncbi:MAG TPA: twin-arginine translocase TatA/TatE family subunit [Acidimicrobiales bacterium]|nr:twin-arginine translocase TatA/TatE family subunit [Acidimicrobiales bacterium]
MPAGVLANILGPDGLIVIAVIVIVLLFGGSQLPKLARGLGSASHEFRKGLEEGERAAATKQEADRETSS